MSSVALDITGLVQLGAPILCADTCTVLDLMRAPTREDVRANHRQAALALLAGLESGTQLVGLLAEQVYHELDGNRPAVEEETRNGLEKLKAQVERVEGIAAVYGGLGTADLAHLDDHLARAIKIADRWRTASRPVPAKPDVTSRAFTRVTKAVTPASKGKESMKDCVVIETYLDVSADLRAAGFGAPIVFASSNTRDYAMPASSALKSDLAQEFANLNIDYAPNLAAAKHLLGL